MTNEQLIEDLKDMIQSSTKHLMKAIEDGERAKAHDFLDGIIDARRALEDLESR